MKSWNNFNRSYAFDRVIIKSQSQAIYFDNLLELDTEINSETIFIFYYFFAH